MAHRIHHSEARARRAAALPAVAIGAFAVGALAIGVLAIGRLAIRSTRIGSLEIDELRVRHINVPGKQVDRPDFIAASMSSSPLLPVFGASAHSTIDAVEDTEKVALRSLTKPSFASSEARSQRER
jgi:hypothetical protein